MRLLKSLFAQISGVVEGCGITEIARRNQRGGETNSLAILQERHGMFFRIDIEADSQRCVLRLRIPCKRLGLDVNSLPKGIGAFLLQFTFGSHMCGDCEFSVTEGRGRSAVSRYLHCQRASRKDRAKAKAEGGQFSAMQKIDR